MEDPKPLSLREVRDLLNTIVAAELLDQPAIFLPDGEADPVFFRMWLSRNPEGWIYNNDINIALPLKEFKRDYEEYDRSERNEIQSSDYSVVMRRYSFVFTGYAPPEWARIKPKRKSN